MNGYSGSLLRMFSFFQMKRVEQELPNKRLLLKSRVISTLVPIRLIQEGVPKKVQFKINSYLDQNPCIFSVLDEKKMI